ncbi:MAG: hypothetical protein QM499_09280 [Flavobacteriaceae bacterium]
MKTIIILIYFICTVCYSQSEKGSYNCNLQKENKEWILKYENSSTLSERIELLKIKIISDSKYSYYKPKVIIHHQQNQTVNEQNEYCGCKNLYLLFYSKKVKIRFDENPSEKILNLTKELNDFNIKEINMVKYLPEYENEHCYTFMLITENKDLKKKIKNIL